MSTPSIAWNELMNIDGRDFHFVFVEDGRGLITECDFGRAKQTDDRSAIARALFIGNAPVLNMILPDRGNPSRDRLLFCGVGRARADRSVIDTVERAGNSGFSSLTNAVEAIKPILTMLRTGPYIVYYTKLYPTDGAGNFFWSLSGVSRELRGSADRMDARGKESTTLPCFMLPTQHPALFNSGRVQYYRTLIQNGGNVGGVALHTAGLFAALLDGHHRAAAALLEGVDFYSLIIERVDGFYFEGDTAPEDQSLRPQGLISVSTKIPFGLLSQDVIRRVLLLRRGAKPENYYDLRVHYYAQEQGYRGGMWSDEIIKKSELLPDVEMLLSAQALRSVSDEQLAALLEGKTEHDGRPIVSQNLYGSIVTAINFLRFTDIARFIDFSLAVLDSYRLTATHMYVCERLRKVQDVRIYDFFKRLLEDTPKDMARLAPIAEEYVQAWELAHKDDPAPEQGAAPTDSPDSNETPAE